VAWGCQQKQGVDYSKTYALMAKWHTIKAMSPFVKAKGWKVHHPDVKTTFLDGRLQEKVFMQQPQGYKKSSFTSLVCKLNHALYGLK